MTPDNKGGQSPYINKDGKSQPDNKDFVSDQIETSTYEADVEEFTCPVCGEIFKYLGEMDGHLRRHVKSAQKKETRERFTTPCGCNFDYVERAEAHINMQKRLCGYYWRAPNGQIKSALLKIVHIEDNKETYDHSRTWQGVILEVESPYFDSLGYGSHSKYVEEARSNSNIPSRIDSRFVKISEEEFVHIYDIFMAELKENILKSTHGGNDQ